jgi:hypothetical protein
LREVQVPRSLKWGSAYVPVHEVWC